MYGRYARFILSFEVSIFLLNFYLLFFIIRGNSASIVTLRVYFLLKKNEEEHCTWNEVERGFVYGITEISNHDSAPFETGLEYSQLLLVPSHGSYIRR